MIRPIGIRTRWYKAWFRLRYRLEVVRRIRRKSRAAKSDTQVAVIYVYPVVGDHEHDKCAERFVSSYRLFHPLHEHTLHVVFNGSEPGKVQLSAFDGIEIVQHQHDDSGWDIGAFQAAARTIGADLAVFCGGRTYFIRAGWLKRMVEAWRSHGDGLYGASASYERDPHIRTTAFWCDPMLVRAYPRRVRTLDHRYAFEAGPLSLTRLAEQIGLACWLVTWDGDYPKRLWRAPDNVFRRGDQSNALAWDNHFDRYADSDEESRAQVQAAADTWQPEFDTHITAPKSERPTSRFGTGWYTKEILSGPQFDIGDYTYGYPEVLSYGEDTRLHIGRFCSIAVGTRIFLGGEHRPDWVSTYPFPPLSGDWPRAEGLVGTPGSKGDVFIGNDVWIGHGASILSGVTIGDGAVIGAMSVVAKDVPPYAVVVGNPARMVKMRFDEQTVNRLIELKWWEWPYDRVSENIPLLCSDRIREFLERNGSG